MSKPTVSADLYKRHKTRYAGVFYRLRADGSRTYAVSFGGKFVAAGNTEKEALAKQAQLRRHKARGEKIVVNGKITFRELAAEWLEIKNSRLRPRTRAYYRDALDLVLLPRFGSWKVSAVDAEAISRLIRDLERDGLHALDSKRPTRALGRSSIENYLKPALGILKLAVRRRLIADNPFGHLTDDDRPKREETSTPHEWTDEELDKLLAACAELAQKPGSRYDYTPLIRLTTRLGLRIGEVLGLSGETLTRTRGSCTSSGNGSGPVNTGRRRRKPEPAASRSRPTSGKSSWCSGSAARSRRTISRCSHHGRARRLAIAT